jgi:hypothetical protein
MRFSLSKIICFYLRHPKIVKLYEIEESISTESFRDLYLNLEHMDDLHKYYYLGVFS